MKILHMNTCNYGSTGEIMLGLSDAARNADNTVLVSYPKSKLNERRIVDNELIIGGKINRYLHVKLGYYTGYNECYSAISTSKFLHMVSKYKPDIIHLHNLHGNYINIKMLFNYIIRHNIPVVWTFHDCWPITGKCTHFAAVNCYKWKLGCDKCPQLELYPAALIDRTKRLYSLKKSLFSGVRDLTVVTPSEWLSRMVELSFLGGKNRLTINNGINTHVFVETPSNLREEYSIGDRMLILGVAGRWSSRKGYDTFIELANRLNDSYRIVLVGNISNKYGMLPGNVINISSTTATVLAKLYSAADVFLNPSIEETMGMVTIEAISCGTPAIVSDSTAVPEVVTASTGRVVTGGVEEYYNVIINKEYPVEVDSSTHRIKYCHELSAKKYIEVYRALHNRNTKQL